MMQQMSSPPQLPARIAAFAVLSDDDLINTATEMPPEEFEEFLFPAELKALVEMPSGAVPADPGKPVPASSFLQTCNFHQQQNTGRARSLVCRELGPTARSKFSLTLSTR
jgi:hypothetical protein